ncbi:BTB/POZ domain-containing protein 18 [Engystomops pustulosus]|uniref:BTB/POZ domain-containing protein 18 n=1 Tax=Engystomops pustulosus TaxID=76066 RepID=UPI003AFABDF3
MASLRFSYCNPRLLRSVFSQLQHQQRAGLFCDVTLQGDGEGIDVHSCVVAACSPYLSKLLLSPSKIPQVSETTILSKKRVLRLSGISSLHLFPLVRYMYTSELDVAPRDVGGVLSAAQKLQIAEVEQLQLERGRLVRVKSEKRLNRRCLDTKTLSQFATCNPSKIQGAVQSRTHTDIDVSSANVSDIEQSNESSMKMETSKCCASEMVLNSSDVLSGGSSPRDLVNSHSYIECVPSSHDVLQYTHCNESPPEEVPLGDHKIQSAESSRVLLENDLVNRDLVPDDKQNLQSDLIECKLKGSSDYVPNNSQGLVGQPVHADDLLYSIESTKTLPEDIGQSQETEPRTESNEALVENNPKGQETQDNLHKGSTITFHEQNKSNGEAKPRQSQQSGCDGKPEIDLLNGKSGDIKREETTSDSPELLKFRAPNNNKNTDPSFPDITEKQNTVHSKKPCLAKYGMDTTQASEKCYEPSYCYWHNLKHKDELLQDESETPKVNANHSMSCISLDSLERACSDLVNEMHNEDLTSITQHEPDAVEHKGLMSRTHGELYTSLAIGKSKAETKKRPYNFDDSENGSIKRTKTSDGPSREHESLHIISPCNENFTVLEEQVKEMLCATRSMSPDLDVGDDRLPVFLGECVRPDLSSDSDTDVDILS